MIKILLFEIFCLRLAGEELAVRSRIPASLGGSGGSGLVDLGDLLGDLLLLFNWSPGPDFSVELSEIALRMDY